MACNNSWKLAPTRMFFKKYYNEIGQCSILLLKQNSNNSKLWVQHDIYNNLIYIISTPAQLTVQRKCGDDALLD